MNTPDPSSPRTRLVVYTALVGPKEPLNNPLALLPAGACSDLELDFVCLTDNRALRSDVWRFEYLPTAHLPPEKLSRRPKAMPQAYFPEATYSLYIDNTVSFKRLPQASDLVTSRPYLFRAFQHARHTQLAQEVYAVAALGYEDASVICQQLDFYAQCLPLSDITPMTTATVLLRNHQHPTVQRFGSVWWENILAFAKRDQLSFDFALRMAGAEVDYLPGITRDNTFVHWQGSLAPTRLRASFDARRYAWLHRDDPWAVRDPKGHALAHERGAEPAYQRPTRLLEVLCQQNRCSLGQGVSPRRGVADVLEPLLTHWRQPGMRFLLARLQGDTAAQAMSATEHDAASQTLAHFMSAGTEGTVLDVSPTDLADSGRVYAAGQQPAQDLVLLLGLPGPQLLNAVQKLVRLVKREHGGLVLLLTSSAALADVAEAERLVQQLVGRSVSTAVQASQHDSQAGPLHNTLVSLSW